MRPSHNVNFGAPFGQEDGFYSQGDFASSATVLGTSDSLHVFKIRILAYGPAMQPAPFLCDREPFQRAIRRMARTVAAEVMGRNNNTRRVAWGKSGRPQFVPVASLVVG